MPWSAYRFRKHNKDATLEELKVGADVANKVLEETGDEGRAVAAGNAAIQRMKEKK